MKLRKTIAALSLLAVLPLSACGAATASDTTATAATASVSATDTRPAGGPDAAVDVGSVTTEAQLIALVQAAYGEAGLGLHRGHQPVQDVLDAVLTISHDELHVRMEEQGQNLSAIAEDLGVGTQTLVDALVESWSPAVDDAVASGAITEDEAEQYRAALEEAFTFKVTWDGETATPTFTGLSA